MTAVQLADELAGRGFALAAGGRLQVRPASALTPRDREMIRSLAVDLVAALGPPRQAPEPWTARPRPG